MKVIVEHTGGARIGQRQEFEDPALLRFGRHPSNEIQFDAYQDLDASARHAELRWEKGGFVLHDVGSSNGTIIGQERVNVRPLSGGEEVQFGAGGPRVRILFEDTSQPPATARPPGPRQGEPPRAAPAGASASSSSSASASADGRLAAPAGALARPPAALGAAAPAAPARPALPPPPGGVRTTVFRRAVEAAVQQATRSLRRLVVGLGLLAAIAAAGLLLYRARAETRAEELRRKMVELMERQRTAGDSEQAELRRRLETLNAELRKAGGGSKVSRAAHGAIYLVAAQTAGAEEGFCTAFALEPQILVTNAHCIAAADGFGARGGRIFVVRNGHPEDRFWVAETKKHPRWKPSTREVTEDVGLLRIEGRAPNLLQVAADDELRRLAPGDTIFLYGFPGRLADTRSPEATFVQGVIGRMTRLSGEAAAFESAQLIQHSAYTSGGTSGSPVFDEAGHVIAINAGGYVESGTMQVLDPQSGRAGEMVVAKNLFGYNFGMRVDLVRDVVALVKVPGSP